MNIASLLKKAKKYLTDAEYRFFIDANLLHKYDALSDAEYLDRVWKVTFGSPLDFTNPATFNEKLQWLKLYDRRPEYTTMVDKFAVKQYVAERLGEEYIIPTLGVWDRFEDIDFDSLPDQFVLKCTHDSGGLVVCKDKSKLDKQKAKKKINKSSKCDYYLRGREWPYKDVPRKIIAEQYMEDANSYDLRDYKFYCFHGEPKFLYLSEGLSDHSKAHISFVSMGWEKMPVKRSDYAEFDTLPDKPENFDKMVEICKQLSANIPFLRVDLYEINGKIYFGELTFFPGSGFTALEPEEWDYTFGSWIELPSAKTT